MTRLQLPFIVGPKMRVGEPHIRQEDILTFEEAWARGGIEELSRAVPASYVEGMTASGTPEEVRRRVQRYRDAGVQVALLRPAAARQAECVLDMLATR